VAPFDYARQQKFVQGPILTMNSTKFSTKPILFERYEER